MFHQLIVKHLLINVDGKNPRYELVGNVTVAASDSQPWPENNADILIEIVFDGRG